LHLANYEDLNNRLHDQGRVLDNHDYHINRNTLGLENTVERLDAFEESSNQLRRRVDIQEDRLDEYQLRLENVERRMTEIELAREEVAGEMFREVNQLDNENSEDDNEGLDIEFDTSGGGDDTSTIHTMTALL
jgi:chromosome segregation ATPase